MNSLADAISDSGTARANINAVQKQLICQPVLGKFEFETKLSEERTHERTPDCRIVGSGRTCNRGSSRGLIVSRPDQVDDRLTARCGVDTQARLIAEELEARHGWNIVPEQVTGKGGSNLAVAIKNEPKDGSTIGIVVTETLGYDVRVADAGIARSDSTPLTTTAGFQMGIVAQTSKGWSNFEDVGTAAKDGMAIRFGVMSQRLADIAYLLGKNNDVDFNIVQVRCGRAVMDGVNANDMDLGFMAGIQTKGVAAGDLVNMVSALSVPFEQTPDAPLLTEFGVEFNAGGHFLIIGPAGMPEEARSALASAISEIVSDSDTKAGGFFKMHSEVLPSLPEAISYN